MTKSVQWKSTLFSIYIKSQSPQQQKNRGKWYLNIPRRIAPRHLSQSLTLPTPCFQNSSSAHFPSHLPWAPTHNLQRLIIRARIPDPRKPERQKRISHDPNPRIPNRADPLGAPERHAALNRARKNKRIQNNRLHEQRLLALLGREDIRLERLIERRSRGVEKFLCGGGRRLRGDGGIEEEFFRRDACDEDFCEDGQGGFGVCELERRDLEVADQEESELGGFESRPEDYDVHADCKSRVRGLDLRAVEQEAVAQGHVWLVCGGARAQQVRWDSDGQDFDVHVCGDGEGRDVVVCR
jgi:hypothetical protein